MTLTVEERFRKLRTIVQKRCSEKKLDSVGSVKSSGRRKLCESVEDVARELQELVNRNSFVFSRFNRSSNYNFGCSVLSRKQLEMIVDMRRQQENHRN